MTILDEKTKNAVLHSMINIIEKRKAEILQANARDLNDNLDIDQVLVDRLKLDGPKMKGMIQSLKDVQSKPDPIHQKRYDYTHPNGMKIVNKTFPFGTILIIYESRPDVTIEAAAIAFKTGNKIILKGGKEALNSNLILVECWHKALQENGVKEDWINYLKLSRKETQQFLIDSKSEIDLIVPRGGESLISFVREHAQCPVLVSGRGNNFLFLDKNGQLDIALNLIENGKMGKISACNALDKVIIHADFPQMATLINELKERIGNQGVTLFSDKFADNKIKKIESEDIWYEEFLDYKLAFTTATDLPSAIEMINKYSGGHSATIVTENEENACNFMLEVDAAAVYHNVSTRFTDGGQFGLGAELAISTDKIHHRGPLGLEHLVTNKWYIYGDGQVR
jgi:glutamate-5-semialdehyde dehydrogenase